MTSQRPRLLLIDDNPDFGGHQVMTAFGVEGLLKYGDWELRALLHPDNQKNRDRWSGIADAHERGGFRWLSRRHALRSFRR